MAKKSKIKSIKAREILDSRGNPAVEVELTTELGVFCASVPSGASVGRYEALELRDGGKRYQGRGVMSAVRSVEKIIAPKLRNKDCTKQKEIDELMIKLDGTKNKSKLGANAILAVSVAVCRAGAASQNFPLYKYISWLFSKNRNATFSTIVRNVVLMPKAAFNVINGGVHAGNELDFQEFMIVPKSKYFFKNLQIASEIYHELKELIKERHIGLAINLGDEGGFAPPLKRPEEALDLILDAAKNLKYQKNIKIFIDVAASEFYTENEEYTTKAGVFNSEELLDYYEELLGKYPISGLEDPFSQDDWRGWRELKSKIKDKKSNLLIIGDDLLATNPDRIKQAKEKEACNAAIIKINQIGTITEALASAKLAKSFGWKIVVSHRSGETCDDFIADFSVGIAADYIKAGAPARGERVTKYNRLAKIEEEMRFG